MSDDEIQWPPRAPTLQSWAGEIRSNTPWFAFPIGMVDFNSDGTITIDRQQFGTCFFISGGIFMTAWHVVADATRDGLPMKVLLLYGGDEAPRDFSFEPVREVERAVDQQGRDTDIAIGSIGLLPPQRRVPRLPLSASLAPAGGFVASFGYARNQWHEGVVAGEDLAHLSINMVPDYHRGTIEEYRPNGRRPFTESAVYIHDAETGGGISGGPLFDVATGRVCGVNSTGLDNQPYSTAADIRMSLDWPIPFAGNRTLRSLAEEGFIDLK